MRYFRHFVVIATIAVVVALIGSVAPANAGGAGFHDDFYTPSLIPNYVSNDYDDFNNFGTSVQACEPIHAGVNSGSSVWFRLQARSSRSLVRLNTNGSDFDTVLAVYRGRNLCTVRFVVANDDCHGLLTSCVQFVAQRNVNYRIAVAGYAGSIAGGAQGNFRLRVVRFPY